MGLECSKTQGFWIRHLRGVQSSRAWYYNRIHLNLSKFIVIINIKNIIICIKNIFNFIIINIKNIIICIINFIVFIIINIINIIITKF
jgi:hypothetical protein